MRVREPERVIELSRTNLLVLLAKLDGAPANSACTIGRDGWWIRAVEDEAHYTDRPRGVMHWDTEIALFENVSDRPQG